MLRLLPYLLILLVVLFFSKLLNIIEDYTSVLNIQESSAQLDKPKSDTGNQVPSPSKNEKTLPKDEDIEQTDHQSLLHENFELESEKKLLQQLRKRRKEIENYKEELSTNKGVLDSIKQYIDNRLKLLESMQHKLKSHLQDYNQENNLEIKKLVKIYESMQPKDAAKIFDDLQLGILIKVTINMKESSLAPILAKMKPEKARELTTRLATKKNSYMLDG